jgi:hypothetical protein
MILSLSNQIIDGDGEIEGTERTEVFYIEAYTDIIIFIYKKK